MRRLSVLIGVLLVLVLGGGSAAAEPPLRLDGRVTDRAGALAPNELAEVQEAIELLRAENNVDLFVVFVDSFDGTGGEEWAHETARLSQLGEEDALLAVAVGDRAYGLSVADGFPVEESRVDQIRTEDVEPRLSAEAWAGAAVALADGLRSGSDGTFGLGLAVVGGAVLVGGGAYLLHRRRRRSAEATPARELPPDEFPDVSTADLAYRASAALIEVDDAVRTSEQELAAARAHFGADAVAEFAAALEQSRADMLRAFALRQQLDDDQPEDERATRALHAEIVRISASADDRLDAQVAAFDALRGLEARAPEYVAELHTRLDGVRARLPEVDAAWAELQTRYAATALEPVAGDLDQSRELLAAAGAELVEAQESLAESESPARGVPEAGEPTASGPAAAVVAARAAEDAITQAETLLDGVARRESELAAAAEKVPAARAEVELDLAEARAMPGDAIAPVVARAAAALAAADEAAGGSRPDPIAALRLLGEAGSALDQGIADARAAVERERKAAAALEQAVLTARSSVDAADDFVTTRRGAVGARARTRIAEARRHLDRAAGPDPVAALREAQQADTLAQEALQLAQADVSQWSRPGVTTSAGADLAGLILGGILSGATSSYRGHRRGGGGFSPGSFGGSSSRGRRGGGGRF
ncbi:TLP18.3/Psb32/MOLO-1 phosphatase superfamily protein [Pseudonocardia hierapolitana]|uniref:TLP18.3/Psb32/MOLO-1 phosphatase superfamily protein n=1 Tax=Pseudonocardia hierapolitana TaxID=1128676 RepID=A0A561SSF3_9PSEU|nr:TPM domain-containing protein [Pseudonocardia hierapolitana]TWF77798.1 TLP18.3/Psb32/MOLO-1 phosphatase superfamily protein [Pseudonocardia hierapolitana]